MTGFCILRYRADGVLDTSFGTTGKVAVSVGGSGGSANASALQADGKLIVVGTCYDGGGQFCATRLNQDGSLDTSFGNLGRVRTAMGDAGANARTVHVQPDGKILVAGDCYDGAPFVFCTLRYTADGALDVTFNGTGKVVTPVSGFGSGRAITVQPDGKIVVAGECAGGDFSSFCAMRYKSDGSLDMRFGNAGKVIAAITGRSSAFAVALQRDGKIALGGVCWNGSNFDFCAIRYNGDGSVDTSFNGVGTVITPIGSGQDYSTVMTIQPDGKIVMAGYCASGVNYDFCAARYDGGPFGYKNCSLDIDGDNRVLAMTDSLIHARIALGITGTAVVNGITFPTTATRNTWPLIRDYLVTQCGMSLVQ